MNDKLREQLKIIAIRPLEGCPQHMLRALSVGQIYYFNKKYSITSEGSCRYIGDENEALSENFFSSSFSENDEKRPLINLNAIVGKNGDGKSSLVELYLRVINNLAYAILQNDTVEYEGHPVISLHAELYFTIEKSICGQKKRDFYRILIEGTDVTIIYPDGSRSTNKDIPESYKAFKIIPFEKIRLQKLFFSMVINYSIFAYNVFDYQEEWEVKDEYESCWLHNLFHKNDGYQTPIVLHPFRNCGNININTENYLTKSRLITLFIEPPQNKKHNFRIINQKQEAIAISCCLAKSNKEGTEYINDKYIRIRQTWNNIPRTNKKNESPIADFSVIEKHILMSWARIYGIPMNEVSGNKERAMLHQAAREYLVYKTIAVSRKYKPYKDILPLFPQNQELIRSENITESIRGLVRKMSLDSSHITLKIRQTLAFLKFQINEWDVEALNQVIPLDKLYDNIKRYTTRDNKKHDWNIIDLLPPPIFDTDIKLYNHLMHEEESFSALSSGERQQIYSVSSILYHLRNLNSVRDLPESDYIHYYHINLILEEIELYFHPDYQRSFIKYLLDSINNINLSEIESINITFVTHSPFVLSDIPIDNVLFLENGKPVSKMQENTFGANIYNLYKNSFFIDGTPIGEFAKEKIQNMFLLLKNGNASDELLQEIHLVGEPLVRSQLLRAFNENLPYSYAKKYKDLEFELQQLKAQLNNDKNRT